MLFLFSFQSRIRITMIQDERQTQHTQTIDWFLTLRAVKLDVHTLSVIEKSTTSENPSDDLVTAVWEDGWWRPTGRVRNRTELHMPSGRRHVARTRTGMMLRCSFHREGARRRHPRYRMHVIMCEKRHFLPVAELTATSFAEHRLFSHSKLPR